MNNICLLGRLCADIELRTTENGFTVTQYRIAVRRPKTKEDITDFFNVVSWRQSAEFLAKYAKKGDWVNVTGMLCNRQYTNDHGEKRYITEIVTDTVQLIGSKREPGTPSGEPSMPNIPPDADLKEVGTDQDLPF